MAAVCFTQLQADPNWQPPALRRDQLADSAIGPILRALEEGRRPDPEDAAAMGSEARALWLQWASLQVEDGVLYRRWEHPSGDPHRNHLQLVLPRVRVQETVKKYHALPGTGSHFKVTRTMAKLRERFYWPQAFQDCRDIIAGCTECGRAAGTKHHRAPGPMRVMNDNTFLGRWAVDLAGHFPPPVDSPQYAAAARSSSRRWYVLVCVEHFTGWPECIVIQGADAETSARAIVDNIVARYGAFPVLHSDQGRNWEAAVFAEVLRLLQIRRTRTSGFYPKGNSRAERFIQTLIKHLTVVVAHNQRDWPSWIPLILLAYRTAPHSSTGVSPAEMLYGRMLNLPMDLVREPPPGREPVVLEKDYPRWLRDTLRQIHDDARRHRSEVSLKMKQNYDVHASIFRGQPGDRVWLYRPVRRTGQNRKLIRAWDGPYVVVDRINELLVRIEHLKTRKRRVANIQNVSRCHDAPQDTQSAWLTVV
ncbi:Retrovirus-related Pol polyprotein from transposon 412 [Frankliniella fusca]|uniref:RNA-directed DNA polymerase n=1 Tax=Frankliniella fusca TaxID=407009 RepID=A0AAE1LDQ2_9NEOP|nr:Retrovirus-related Pol polyprotein from transposon 412 [Frankliniella fusca]